MKRFYVYYLIDPRTGQPFYVGKGQGNRIYSHVGAVLNNRVDHNVRKCERIKDIINQGLDVKHEIVEWFDTSKDALRRECELIKQWGRVCNNTGVLLNEKQGDEKPRKTEKRVKQCEYTTGKIIAIHESTKAAAAALGVSHYSSISNAIAGRSPSYLGYLWCYEDSDPVLPTTLIYQWDVCGTLLNIHKNEGDARRAIKLSQAVLHQAIELHRFCGGYIWSRSPTFPGVPSPKPRFPVWEHGLRNKAVMHVQTQQIFDTVSKAAKTFGHSVGAVSAVCSGKRDNISGNVFIYVDQQKLPTVD